MVISLHVKNLQDRLRADLGVEFAARIFSREIQRL